MASSRCRSFLSFVWFASAATCPSRVVQVVEREHHRPGGRRGTQDIPNLLGQAVHRIEEEHPFRWGQLEPDLLARLDLLLPGHGLPSCEIDPWALMDRQSKPSLRVCHSRPAIGSIVKSARTVQSAKVVLTIYDVTISDEHHAELFFRFNPLHFPFTLAEWTICHLSPAKRLSWCWQASEQGCD